MSANAKIISALTGIVGGNIWAIQKPVDKNPDRFIVFNPEAEYIDYGDDRDWESEMSWQVHWYAKGVANPPRRQIRDALRNAGFLIEPSPYLTYESEAGAPSTGVQTGYTHMTIVCRMDGE